MEAATNLKFVLARPEEEGGENNGENNGGNNGENNGGGSNNQENNQNNNNNQNQNQNQNNQNNQNTSNNTNPGNYTNQGNYSNTGNVGYYTPSQTVYATDGSVVAVPNTGERVAAQTSGQSALLPIFIGIFILASIAIIARLIIKQKKSHLKFAGDSKLSIRPLQVSLVGSSTLALLFLGMSLINNASIENQRTADAASSELSISSLGTVEKKIEDKFDDPAFIYTAKDVVKVESSSSLGYRVFVQAESDKLYLNGDSKSEELLSSTTSNSLEDGTWGYHVGNTETWSAVPTTTTEIAKIASTENATNPSETEVYYGVNPADNLKNGTYSTKITYTVVADEPEPVPMQNIDVTTLPEGKTSRVYDTRDGQEYTAYRWPTTGTAGVDYPEGLAGTVIMTKDLALGHVTGNSVTRGSDLTLTDEDSAAHSSITIPAKTGASDWISDDDFFHTSNKQYINGAGGTYDSHSYYSWTAAIAVCPKGWWLPTKADYNNIITFMGGDNATGSSTIRNAPYNFLYGGSFTNTTEGYKWDGIGTSGMYWTIEVSLGNSANSLMLQDAVAKIQPIGSATGASVRCISKVLPADPEPTVPDCSDTVHPTAEASCKMADGKEWILGTNGNNISWNDAFRDATGEDGHDATLRARMCPTGYVAPKITDFDALVQAYGGAPFATTVHLRDGYKEETGAVFGALGLSSGESFWSSTENTNELAFVLFADNSESLTTGVGTKTENGKLLCYKSDAEPEPLPMQTTSVADFLENTTSKVKDTRDGQVYTVYRWPTTGTAGTDYPEGLAGAVIMTKDLSIGYVTGNTIFANTDLALTTADSAGEGNILVRTDISNWSTTNSDTNLQYINGAGGDYDSHSYYSYGAAQIACPKGWRLPTITEYEKIISFMGGFNATGASTISRDPYKFFYGGQFDANGWANVGASGFYWSSSQAGNANSSFFQIIPSNLYTNYGGKNTGMLVRCIATAS